jgi:hypothetical protein
VPARMLECSRAPRIHKMRLRIAKPFARYTTGPLTLALSVITLSLESSARINVDSYHPDPNRFPLSLRILRARLSRLASY